MKQALSWVAAMAASLVFVAFPLMLGVGILVIGCSSAIQGHDDSGGAGGTSIVGSSSSASSTSAASSSSGAPAPECSGESEIQPGYGEGGGYYEDDVLACRRFVPAAYPFAVDGFLAKYPTSSNCSQVPSMVWAIGAPEQLTGFAWSPPVPAQAGGTGMLSVGQELVAGQAFWACLRLASNGSLLRSCVSGCKFQDLEQNGDFFWGDTYPPDGTMAGGHVINPPVLEPLSASPTKDLAAALGNNKAGLQINVLGGP
jgi:hypothetical protein